MVKLRGVKEIGMEVLKRRKVWAIVGAVYFGLMLAYFALVSHKWLMGIAMALLMIVCVIRTIQLGREIKENENQ